MHPESPLTPALPAGLSLRMGDSALELPVLRAEGCTEFTMDLKILLAQLREERDKLDSAISNLERLEYGHHGGSGPAFVTKGPTNGIHRGYRLPNPEPGEA